MIDTLSLDDHKARHLVLHRHLDELVADMINHTSQLPSQTTVSELIKWSHEQTLAPTVKTNPASSAADGAVTSNKANQ